jgi:hypothetical protein
MEFLENEQEMEAATLEGLRETVRTRFERIKKSLNENEMAQKRPNIQRALQLLWCAWAQGC